MPKKIYIRTFGCQMNERDSEIIYSMMMEAGYAPVSSYEQAELIIFNTCSVRKHAEDRVWGKMGQLKVLKGKRKGVVIGLVGCMGQAYGRDIFKRLPHVDFVCGPANIYDIPRLAEEAANGRTHLTATGLEKRPLRKGSGEHTGECSVGYRQEKVRAWVNISEGCNNFCSYCIVPYLRGREVSRPAEDILEEIKHLAESGVKEVTLLGQNVNSYRSQVAGYRSQDEIDFVKLLEKINAVDGLERLRFMTSHPKDATPRLFKAMAGLDKVCEHLHLPLQSGSDRILKLMNRGYSVSDYLKLVDGLRKEIPECAITTDVIVGFPTESEKDFMDTYMLMQKAAFEGAFIFKYSPRPFTKAARMEDDVPKKQKEERNQVLLNLQDKINSQKNEKLTGTTQDLLGLSRAKRRPASSYELSGFYIKGRTRTNQQVVYKADKNLIGTVCNVKIIGVEQHTLIGELA